MRKKVKGALAMAMAGIIASSIAISSKVEAIKDELNVEVANIQVHKEEPETYFPGFTKRQISVKEREKMKEIIVLNNLSTKFRRRTVELEGEWEIDGGRESISPEIMRSVQASHHKILHHFSELFRLEEEHQEEFEHWTRAVNDNKDFDTDNIMRVVPPRFQGTLTSFLFDYAKPYVEEVHDIKSVIAFMRDRYQERLSVQLMTMDNGINKLKVAIKKNNDLLAEIEKVDGLAETLGDELNKFHERNNDMQDYLEEKLTYKHQLEATIGELSSL